MRAFYGLDHTHVRLGCIAKGLHRKRITPMFVIFTESIRKYLKSDTCPDARIDSLSPPKVTGFC